MKYLQEFRCAVFGEPIDEGALAQIKNCAPDGVASALMADHHPGYNMPIGGVVAYDGKVSPAGVGLDIACGNKAVRLEASFADIEGDLPRIAEDIWQTLSFGVGLNNGETVDHELFDDPAWSNLELYQDPSLKENARRQLGTIGSGNHYVDVFKDELGSIWVGVHFGSRGLGHRTATYFIKAAGQNPNVKMDEAPKLLDADSPSGCDYIEGMKLAGRYAYAGRDWVCSRVAQIIGAPIVEEVHNHHNFAWLEDGLWVVRKGATPAYPGQRGFVGGSMGDDSVIIVGLGSDMTLNSTIHGAGRVMSRTQAAGKMRWVKGKPMPISEGCINMASVREEIAERGTILKGAGADEAPAAYKRLPEVLAHHAETIEVQHTLTPLIVCMAGEETHDPFKD